MCAAAVYRIFYNFQQKIAPHLRRDLTVSGIILKI